MPRNLSQTQKDTLKLIGERMRQLRIQQGYRNYENFAFEHDLPRAQYGRYERGEDLYVSSLIKVAEALGLTLEEFFKIEIEKVGAV